MISLYEFLVKDKTKIGGPKDKNELIKAIKTELDKGNTNLNCIDTSNIKDMDRLFDQDEGIKLTDEQQKTLNVSKWDLSNVKNMCCMFYKCEQFNCDLSNWKVDNVEYMQHMFHGCKQFNCDLSNWKVDNVTRMFYMFCDCTQFKSDLSNWKVDNVKYMNNMFDNCPLEGKEPAWYKK